VSFSPSVRLLDTSGLPLARFILRERTSYARALIAFLLTRGQPFIVESGDDDVRIDLLERRFDSEKIVRAFNDQRSAIAGRLEMTEGRFEFTRRRSPRNPDCSHLDFVPIVNALRSLPGG
jgi:hypothetical protein